MAEMAYLGVKPCGCAVAAVVDTPAHRGDTARETAAWIREGLAVERVSVEEARTRLAPCRCKGNAAQGAPTAKAAT